MHEHEWHDAVSGHVVTSVGRNPDGPAQPHSDRNEAMEKVA